MPRSRIVVALFWAAAALAPLAGGCATDAGRNLVDIYSEAEFDQRVLGATDRPVLVEINKDQCPTCVAQAAELDKLADEYRGRVLFYKYKIMDKTFGVIAPRVRDQYRLYWVPTTVLFVKGQERKRWVFNHLPIEFRGQLDKAIAEFPNLNPQQPPAYPPR